MIRNSFFTSSQYNHDNAVDNNRDQRKSYTFPVQGLVRFEIIWFPTRGGATGEGQGGQLHPIIFKKRKKEKERRKRGEIGKRWGKKTNKMTSMKFTNWSKLMSIWGGNLPHGHPPFFWSPHPLALPGMYNTNPIMTINLQYIRTISVGLSLKSPQY